MIGYYVHHQGSGHRQRAAAVARHLRTPVTGLSSLPPPDGWPGPWIELPRDDRGPDPVDPTASGVLHWVPEHDDGLRIRTAVLSGWIATARPSLVVTDVSVEVALLARLHGVPVVTVVLPGDRTDGPHRLAHGVSRRIVSVWPQAAAGMVDGLEPFADRFDPVGGLSRFDDRIGVAPSPGPGPSPRAVLMLGTGGADLTAAELDRIVAATPGWRWTVLDPRRGTRVEEPWPVLASADVVVTHAGQNALAEVAAARVPAVVVPQDRPHREQRTTAAALLRGGWPVLVAEDPRGADWPALLERARSLPGEAWATWNDGRAARRFAAILDAEAAR